MTTARMLTTAGLATLLAGAVLSCGPARQGSDRVPHDAYVWQRVWTKHVRKALRDSAPFVGAWRVLAAEVEAGGAYVQVASDLQAIAASGKPTIMVVRINGNAIRWDRAGVARRIADMVHEWRAAVPAFNGVEIDHDCATHQLALYRDFLKQVRRALPHTRVSITALPDWVASRDLAALLITVDEAVLQVHSVVSPDRGLFDVSLVERWVAQWSKVVHSPFRIALPNYWSRIVWDDAGRVSAVQSELRQYRRGGTGREQLVMPQDVSRFVRHFSERAPRNFVGFSWFRLPTDADRRSWSAETWQAVMNGGPIAEAQPFALAKRGPAGAIDLFVVNGTSIDSRLPTEVELANAGQCYAADALPPYRIEWKETQPIYRLSDVSMLRARMARRIGWARCEGQEATANAQF